MKRFMDYPFNQKRVVVTGMGVVTPIGLNTEEFWTAWRTGQSGIGGIDRFDVSRFKSKIAGQIDNFDPLCHMDRKDLLRLDRFTHLAKSATDQAFIQSGLDHSNGWKKKAGVLVGSGLGGIISLCEQMDVMQQDSPRRVNPFLMPMFLINAASAYISLDYKLKGPSCNVSTACASGLSAVVQACNLIQSGELDVIFAGGSDAPIVPIILAAFDALNALASKWNDNPTKASRPFDSGRKGFVLSEGSAILCLEERQHAEDRNADILCEIVGGKETCDAYHMVSPLEDGAGVVQSITQALIQADVKPDEVDYINAHATSTVVGDRCEAQAIKQVFNHHSDTIAVSAIKEFVGHMLGASGPIGLVGSILAINKGYIPPSRNLESIDPACDINIVSKNVNRTAINTALVNSSGFGGHNASVLVRSFDK
jgi:3-oxoacyl-[acyl-carrier-protein] synthase II